MKFFPLFLFLLFPFFAFAHSGMPMPSGFVNDFAGVLSAEQKQALEAKAVQFEQETSNEIAVAIVQSLGDFSVEEFAVDLFEDWGVGKESRDNGVLILVALDERKMRIEVGYGLEGALTDAQSFSIIDQIMRPAFQAGDYYVGIDGAINAVVSATKGEYTGAGSTDRKGASFSISQFFWLFLFVFIYLASILGRSKSWWAGGVVGGVIGIIFSLVVGFLFAGLIALAIFVPLGLLFDFLVSRSYHKSKTSGHVPWWFGGGGSGRGGGFGGFGGFGGGRSGGGGSSGGW